MIIAHTSSMPLLEARRERRNRGVLRGALGAVIRTRDKVLLGTLPGAGLAWGGREGLRARRRTTLDDRVVVITGASTGCGLVAASGGRGRCQARDAARNAEELRAAGGRAGPECDPRGAAKRRELTSHRQFQGTTRKCSGG